MNVVGHDHPRQRLDVREMRWDFLPTNIGIFANRRHPHYGISSAIVNDFPKGMFSCFCADGHEIGSVPVIVPRCACGRYAIPVFE